MDSYGENRTTLPMGYLQTRGGFQRYAGAHNYPALSKKGIRKAEKIQQAPFMSGREKLASKQTKAFVVDKSHDKGVKHILNRITVPRKDTSLAKINETSVAEVKEKLVPDDQHVTTAKCAVDNKCIQLTDTMQVAEG